MSFQLLSRRLDCLETFGGARWLAAFRGERPVPPNNIVNRDDSPGLVRATATRRMWVEKWRD